MEGCNILILNMKINHDVLIFQRQLPSRQEQPKQSQEPLQTIWKKRIKIPIRTSKKDK